MKPPKFVWVCHSTISNRICICGKKANKYRLVEVKQKRKKNSGR